MDGPSDTNGPERGLSQHEKEVSKTGIYDNSLEAIEAETTMMPWQQRMQFYEAVSSNSGNRTINDDIAEEALKALTIDADDIVEYTYRRGKQDIWESSAPFIEVAIHYVPGADLAQVNKLENSLLNKDPTVRKSERWKTLTAGNLLLELEVQNNLEIILVDQTAAVLATYRDRQRNGRPAAAVTSNIKDLITNSDGEAVNISSKNVTLLNEFSRQKKYDLESTCIEVDGISLLNLIYNFRDLLSKQGEHATLPAQHTVRILETMIEDARRLLVRSPVLTRAVQRVVIQSSRNTRYGFDTGERFHTFTTSHGIAEMIQQGVAYYSSLTRSNEAQRKIRPQFLQMVVFLLSLLNDTDLERLRPSLEKSYDLKADRQTIELTLLKVLTYEAVGPYSFLTGVIGAVQRKRIEIEDTVEAKAKEWDDFLEEIGRLGWILPGNAEQVGRDTGSWKVEWQKTFVSSDIFDQLQYSGEKDTVNAIPPLKINSEALALQEVSAELTNGKIYQLTTKDLDEITMAIKNRYVVTDPSTKVQSDLVVKEEVIFSDVDTAWENLQRICSTVNESAPISAAPNQKSLPNTVKKILNQKAKPRRQYFTVKRPLGHRTKCVTSVISGLPRTEEIIAISWKLNGRRITHNELLKGVNLDITRLLHCLAGLKNFAGEQEKAVSTLSEPQKEQLANMVARLTRGLTVVEQALKNADEVRQTMQSTFSQAGQRDEPIMRVHFPGQLHWLQDLPFCPYKQLWTPEQIKIQSEKCVVSEEPVWNANIATLKLGDNMTAMVTPLNDLGETMAFEAGGPLEEIKKGDIVLLVGNLVLIVEAEGAGFHVETFLKLTGLTRGASVKKRRRAAEASQSGMHESILI